MSSIDNIWEKNLIEIYFIFKEKINNGQVGDIWLLIREEISEKYPIQGSPFGAFILSCIDEGAYWHDEPLLGKDTGVHFSVSNSLIGQLWFLEESISEGIYDKEGYSENIYRLLFETLYALRAYEEALVILQRAAKYHSENMTREQENDVDFGINDILFARILCLARSHKTKEVTLEAQKILKRDSFYGGYEREERIALVRHLLETCSNASP